jgi:3-oxoadipate CoA-transferase, beta subunit
LFSAWRKLHANLALHVAGSGRLEMMRSSENQVRAWSPAEMAQRGAPDIPDSAILDLGIGLPTLVGSCLSAEREIILRSENGVIGIRDDGGRSSGCLLAGSVPSVCQWRSRQLVHGRSAFRAGSSRGAMDLAIGAKLTYVMMTRRTKAATVSLYRGVPIP